MADTVRLRDAVSGVTVTVAPEMVEQLKAYGFSRFVPVAPEPEPEQQDDQTPASDEAPAEAHVEATADGPSAPAEPENPAEPEQPKPAPKTRQRRTPK